MSDDIEKAMNYLTSKAGDKTIDDYIEEFKANGGKIKKLPTIKKETKQITKGRLAKRVYKLRNR